MFPSNVDVFIINHLSMALLASRGNPKDEVAINGSMGVQNCPCHAVLRGRCQAQATALVGSRCGGAQATYQGELYRERPMPS